jgi:anti-sigma factor RsiW
MNEHLSDLTLNALADSELSAEQLVLVNEHLAECPSCTSAALHQSLLKSATAKAGLRYTPSSQFQARLAHLASQEGPTIKAPRTGIVSASSSRSLWGFGSLGWAAAAVLLVAFATNLLFQRIMHKSEMASAAQASLMTEVFDEHIATLADNMPPQVVSTDRHTVKPWFQGKIPFSFNLPQTLPSNTTLDGANLSYLEDRPVAQLLFSIGKHRVSVFLRQRSDDTKLKELLTERAGFHLMAFSTNNLEAVAVSDVDASHLAELVEALKEAQAGE